MSESVQTSVDAKAVFRKCGTCSQTFGHILNREYGHPKEMAELALDPLAGGILNQGHQCGMLWGAILAVGAESYRRHDDIDEAIAVTVTAAQHIIESFTNRTSTVNCREITGYNLSSVFGMVSFGLKTMLMGMNNSPCFVLAEDWAPEAIESAETGLSEDHIQLKQQPLSCASEIAKRMGVKEEVVAMVAGFAGGLGLSGNACGGLGAAIWLKTLTWCKENPGKKPALFNNKMGKKIMKTFFEETSSKALCKDISGQKFESIKEHTNYIKNGGCSKLIEVLGQF